jgi:uncharacterized glyoxalase superfamily protein PhnB
MKNFVLINFASVSGRLRVTWAQAWSLLTTTMSLFHYASAQEMNLNPTRPTVANSAIMQSRGVVQVETGYDSYPRSVPGSQQTVDMFLTYTPLPRLRLDFGWSAFNHQQDGDDSTNGVGTIQIGGKIQVKKEQYHRSAPAIGFQYEAELPTASQRALQGYGQQAILLINHHYGKSGYLDVIVNGSLVQSGGQTPFGCSYGGQQSFAVSYHFQKETRLYAEAFGQNTAQSNTPPGTYLFGGFYHQVSDAFGIDGGLRFGVSDHSARVGKTIGLVFGERLRSEPSQRPLTVH